MSDERNVSPTPTGERSYSFTHLHHNQRDIEVFENCIYSGHAYGGLE